MVLANGLVIHIGQRTHLLEIRANSVNGRIFTLVKVPLDGIERYGFLDEIVVVRIVFLQGQLHEHLRQRALATFPKQFVSQSHIFETERGL